MTVRFSIFQRRRKAGRPKDSRYTIELRFPDGTVKQKVAFTDKAATQQLAAKLVRDIERKEMGLFDPLAEHRRTALGEHAKVFLAAMKNGALQRRRRGAPTAEWVEKSRRRLAWLFTQLGATRIEHLRLADVEQLLADRMANGWSAKTRDDHAALLRLFGRWLTESEPPRASTNPFQRLRLIADGASRTFLRHALTVDELVRLVDAAEVRPLQEGVKVNPWMSEKRRAELAAGGVERGLLYRVAAYTGLRLGEVLALQWLDLRLGTEPAIEVRAETAKSGKAARIEIPRWLGQMLEQRRAVVSAGLGAPPAGKASVWSVTYRHVTERLQRDAVFAGIGTIGMVHGKRRVVAADGRVIDFHALRGTLATLADESGMSPKAMQELLRHSDIQTTMQSYVQARRATMRAAVEGLPSPWSVPASGTVSPSESVIARQGPSDRGREGTGS